MPLENLRLKMAFMTFSVLDLLWVSWLFMQVGLCPKDVLTLPLMLGTTQRKEALL